MLKKIKNIKNTLRSLLILLISTLTLTLMIGCSAQKQNMPEFSTVDFQQNLWKSTELKGKVFVMHFWATSCTSCIEEMPLLKKHYENLKNQADFKMLAVNMPYDPPSYIIAYQQKERLPFAMSFDIDGKISKAFNVQATPTTFIFNKKGQRVQTIVGPVSDNFDETILALLKE